MKPFRFLSVVILMALLLAACQPLLPSDSGSQAGGTPTSAGQTESSPTPGSGPKDAAADAVDAARKLLADELGIPAGDIQVVGAEPNDWPDACLGLGGAAEICAAVITPGYLVQLAANGAEYALRANQTGSIVRREGGANIPAAAGVIKALADKLGIDASLIQVVSVAPIEFSDSCLGLGGPAESCLQVMTPGYIVTLQANGQDYVFHVNEAGTLIREASGAALPPSDPVSDAVLHRLVMNTGYGLSEVKIVSKEAVEWKGGCLEIPMPGVMCTLAIIDGYRVIAEAGGQRFEYRTNQDGTTVLLFADPQGDLSGKPAISLEETVNGQCRVAGVSAAGLGYGACNSEGSVSALARYEQAVEFEYIVKTFKPFTLETGSGTLTFEGRGSREASAAEQRSVLEWLRLAESELAPERGPAVEGLALSWTRIGGIAGFNDSLEVSLGGFGLATSRDVPATFRLTGAELEQLYAWVDRFKPFEYEFKDSGTADSMTTQFTFNGRGSAEPGEEEKAAISAFASILALRASAPSIPAGEALGKLPASANLQLGAARDTLIDFFRLLNEGQYAEAAGLYGGAYETLQNNNPDIAASDKAALLERACSQNGYQCLQIKDVVGQVESANEGFSFTVTFAGPDGSLFEQGPCCGDTSGSPVSEFVYAVAKIDGAYKVMGLPPYVP